MFRYVACCAFFSALQLCISSSCVAQTYYYTGLADGDFFTESNWNDMADGTGASPPVDTIFSSTAALIPYDLVIDGNSVIAEGFVDLGAGSLSLLNGASLDVTGDDNTLDVNPESTLTLSGNSTLTVRDDMYLSGAVSVTDSTLVSVDDDIEFQAALTSLLLDGATIQTLDDASEAANIFFDGFGGGVPVMITGASFVAAEQIGLRNSAQVSVTDTSIQVVFDIEDVFGTAGEGSVLTLLGSSTLEAATVEDGVDVIVDDQSVATLGTRADEVLDGGSILTLVSSDAQLVIAEDITDDPRAFIFNGFTGLDYATDQTTWNNTSWNGLDAVTLQIVPEPTSIFLVAGIGLLTTVRRRRYV